MITEKQIKQDIQFINNRIQSLMLISSNALAAGKERWKFEGHYYNLKTSTATLKVMRNDYKQLKSRI